MNIRLAIAGVFVLHMFGQCADCAAASTAPNTYQNSPQQSIPLASLIDHYQKHGHKILYSSAVVNRSMLVSSALLGTDNLQIDLLGETLASFNLRLVLEQDVYVITSSGDNSGTALTKESHPQNSRASTNLIESIIVTGSMHKYAKPGLGASSRRISSDEMSGVPALGFDAIRIINRLPGSASMGVSARPRIRGGLQDELLVLQDGIELLEPFHLADFHSAYSAIDFYTVESIDIYTGGFPSRYGNRMSGVLDITSDTSVDSNTTKLGISNFSQFANTSRELSGTNKGAWSLSYRRGDLSDLTKFIEAKSGTPRYYDASGRLHVELGGKRSLSLGGSVSRDKIKFEDAEEFASSNVKMRYFWSRFEQKNNPNLHKSWSLNYIDFERRKFSKSEELPDETEDNPEPDKGGFLDYGQDIRRLALRNDYSTVHSSGGLLEFGWQAEYTTGDFRNSAVINRGELADLLGSKKIEERQISIDRNGWSGGAYASVEYELESGLIVQPSMRWDVQTYYQGNTRYQVSPRLGLAYDLSEVLRMRMSLGRFYQPEALHELQVLDGETQYFKPQKSDHFVLGIDWQGEKAHFIADIYYKKYRNQKQRYENIFNPFVLLPELEPDRVKISPEKAFAQGIDLDLSYTFSSALHSTVRYSYMSAKDKLNQVWVPRRWSQKHTLNTSLVWERGSWLLSTAATWHSGWRTSQLDSQYEEGTLLEIEEVLNNVNLGPYFSLDISVRKYWDVGKTRIEVFANITNLSDRTNEAGIDYDFEESEEDSNLLLLPDPEFLPGLIPSIGISITF